MCRFIVIVSTGKLIQPDLSSIVLLLLFWLEAFDTTCTANTSYFILIPLYLSVYLSFPLGKS